MFRTPRKKKATVLISMACSTELAGNLRTNQQWTLSQHECSFPPPERYSAISSAFRDRLGEESDVDSRRVNQRIDMPRYCWLTVELVGKDCSHAIDWGVVVPLVDPRREPVVGSLD